MATHQTHPADEPDSTQTPGVGHTSLEQYETASTIAFAATEASFQELLESSPDAIVIVDAAGHIKLVNHQTEVLFGHQREELLGQLVEILSPAPRRAAHAAHRARYLSQPHRRPMGANLELYGLRKDGGAFPVEISLSPIVSNGETWIISTIRDVSDRKLAQEQLRLSAERLGLLHDIDQAILSGQPSETIAAVTLQRLRQLVPCRRTGVVLLNFVNKEATLLAIDVGGETLLTPGLCGPIEAVQISNIDLEALRQGQQYEIDDLSMLAELPVAIRALQAEGVQALLVTPLVTEGELIGVLNLGKDEPQGFTPAQKEIVQEIANQLALALQRARDIAARQLAEEAVRISEQQYRLLFTQNPHPMWVYDVETLAFLAVNEAAVQHYGYTQEEFLAMTLLDIRPPEETEAFLATIERVRTGGSSTSLTRHRKKDGTLIQVEVSSNDIQFAGRVARVVLAHDVTARLRAEAGSQEEAEITAALVRVGRTMISSLDTPTIVQQLCEIVVDVLSCDCCHVSLLDTKSNVFVNAASFGYTLEQQELLRLSSLPQEALATLGNQFLDSEEAQTVKTAVPPRSMLDAVLQQTDIRTALFVPLRRGSQIIGVLNAACRSDRDFSAKHQRLAKGIAQFAALALTNAKLVEELQEVNRLKDDFVGAMSHELRTPLNVILGYTELLLDDTYGAVSMDQGAALRKIDQHTRELVDLVSNLLDINRLRVRRIPLQLGEIEVDALFAQLQLEVPTKYQKPTVELQWQWEPIPFPLYTDPVKLKVVLKNLINNALKFTDKGTITVAARLEGAGVGFSVRDTGVGIAPEHLPLIFEAFRQVDNSSTRPYGGVGLGLYITRQLLDLLGGSITVDSTPGKGSTFRAWIPVRLQPEGGD